MNRFGLQTVQTIGIDTSYLLAYYKSAYRLRKSVVKHLQVCLERYNYEGTWNPCMHTMGYYKGKKNSSICQACLGISFYLGITVWYALEEKEI